MVWRKEIDDFKAGYSYTAAPIIVKGKIITGVSGGEFGVIASVTRPFCRDCTRARLSADGAFYTCLFAVGGTDLKGPLRGGLDEAGLTRLVSGVWTARADRYSEIRSEGTRAIPKVEMFTMGG